MAISGPLPGRSCWSTRPRRIRSRCTASSWNGLRDAIRAGCLTPAHSAALASAPAADLGDPRRLVVDAYSQPTAEGFPLSRHGSGTEMAAKDAANMLERDTAEPEAVRCLLRPGSPDLGSFPRHAWLRGIAARSCRDRIPKCSATSRRRACSPRAPLSQTICGAPAASSPIRNTSCSARGDPSHRVAASVLADQTVAMEDPGFWLHRMVLRHNGVEPIPVPVDDDGLDVAALADSGATTVLATPAHQSPTGVGCPPRAAPRWCNGPGRVTSSSRMTTTLNTVTTVRLSAHCRASTPSSGVRRLDE